MKAHGIQLPWIAHKISPSSTSIKKMLKKIKIKIVRWLGIHRYYVYFFNETEATKKEINEVIFEANDNIRIFRKKVDELIEKNERLDTELERLKRKQSADRLKDYKYIQTIVKKIVDYINSQNKKDYGNKKDKRKRN